MRGKTNGSVRRRKATEKQDFLFYIAMTGRETFCNEFSLLATYYLKLDKMSRKILLRGHRKTVFCFFENIVQGGRERHLNINRLYEVLARIMRVLTFLYIHSFDFAFSNVALHFPVFIFNFDTSGHGFQRITRGCVFTLSSYFLMSRSRKKQQQKIIFTEEYS